MKATSLRRDVVYETFQVLKKAGINAEDNGLEGWL
jgi:hypothetical protein